MSAPVFVIIAPSLMAIRQIVNSDVLHLLHKKINRQILILSPHHELCENLPEYVEWRDYLKPTVGLPRIKWWRRLIRAASVRFSRYFGFSYANLVFRFNHLQGFYAHIFKQKMNKKRQRREELAGNFVSSKYGFPFPDSRFLYRLIYKFYYSKLQIADPFIEQFFAETEISGLVFWHVQNEIYRDFSVCARRKNLPITAVVGSWDRLTTKGPICPGCKKFVVNSQIMKHELMRHHNINEKQVEVVGWPQMDIYHDKSLRQSKSAFLKMFKFPDTSKILVYAGNASRLGAHEPGLVQHIAEQIEDGKYGKGIYLLVRPHPQDVDWQHRYDEVMKMKNVIVMPSEAGNVELMVNVLSHADVVIATQGSISLDAVAFDRCIINVAFDGNLKKPYHESVSRWYEMDHYRPVVESGGVRVVKKFSELDNTIVDYLNDKLLDAKGRERLRHLQLSPFKGDSSQRQVDAMV